MNLKIMKWIDHDAFTMINTMLITLNTVCFFLVAEKKSKAAVPLNLKKTSPYFISIEQWQFLFFVYFILPLLFNITMQKEELSYICEDKLRSYDKQLENKTKARIDKKNKCSDQHKWKLTVLHCSMKHGIENSINRGYHMFMTITNIWLMKWKDT